MHPSTPVTDTPAFVFQPRKPMKYRVKAPPAPAPTPPPQPAAVTSAALDPEGLLVTLVFDRPLVLVGSPPYGPLDGSIQFNDQTPISVEHPAPDTLTFNLA